MPYVWFTILCIAHSGTSDPNLIESTMEQSGVDEVTNMETDASKLWFTSLQLVQW
jgi:hypothetical protein